jgi:hypothetical protein
MQRITASIVAALIAVVAAASSLAGANEVMQAEAHLLALIYVTRYLPEDCIAQEPTLRAGHWESAVDIHRLHRSNTPAGTIRIEGSSGRVSYRGKFGPKPRVSAAALHHWYGYGHD